MKGLISSLFGLPHVFSISISIFSSRGTHIQETWYQSTNVTNLGLCPLLKGGTRRVSSLKYYNLHRTQSSSSRPTTGRPMSSLPRTTPVSTRPPWREWSSSIRPGWVGPLVVRMSWSSPYVAAARPRTPSLSARPFLAPRHICGMLGRLLC